MRLDKKFGFWTILASTLAAVIGSSIIVTFNQVFFMVGQNPLLMILAWIFGGLIILPDGLLVIEPSIGYQQSGSGYHWIKKCGWKVLGFWFGWILILFVSATSLATCCSAMGSMVSEVFKIENQSLTNLISTGLLVFLAGIQILVKNSNKYTQIFFLIIKSLPIILVFVMAMIYGSNDGLLSNAAINKSLGQAYVGSALLIPAITFTGFAYSGYEFATYVTEEIKEPKKTVPHVMIGSVLIVLLIYITYGVALLSLTSAIPETGGTGAIFADHKGAVLAFNIMAIFLFVGSVNSMLMYQSRMVHKLSETKDVHSIFGTVNKRTNQPYMAIILLCVAALLFIWVQDITAIISNFALATTLLKVLLNSSIIKLRLKDSEYKKIYKPQVFWLLVVVSFICCLLTLVGAIYLTFVYPILGLATKDFAGIFGILWPQILMVVIFLIVYLIGMLYYKLSKNGIDTK